MPIVRECLLHHSTGSGTGDTLERDGISMSGNSWIGRLLPNTTRSNVRLATTKWNGLLSVANRSQILAVHAISLHPIDSSPPLPSQFRGDPPA